MIALIADNYFDLLADRGDTTLQFAAGYLDEGEAWKRIFAVGKALQLRYASWNELAENYRKQRDEHYKGQTPGREEFASRVRAWLVDPRKPPMRLPFKMDLTKS